MYSEEFDNNVTYNDEQYDDYEEQAEQKNGFWKENKGLIIKIVIIVLCLILLFWLIAKIKDNNTNKNNNKNDSAIVYQNNIDSVRLAAEKYFFIDGNLPKNDEVIMITLADLINKGYVGEIVDTNKKSCDINQSNVSLVKGSESYILTINLLCSSTSNPQTYNYSLEKKICLDCTGFTYMDGTTNNEDSDDNNTNIDNNESDSFEESLSCNIWSEWTDKKIDDDRYEVRTRVLVKGFKKGAATEKVTYDDCTDYTKDTIKPTNNTRVETIVKNEQVWVEKTSDKEVKESSTIKDVKKTTTGSGSYSYCPSDDYDKKDGKCVKESGEKVGDLTPVEYNTYNVLNKPCAGISYENGKMVYKNCRYNVIETTNLRWGSNKKTVYTYKELETQEITYSRSCKKKVETI